MKASVYHRQLAGQDLPEADRPAETIRAAAGWDDFGVASHIGANRDNPQIPLENLRVEVGY